MECQRMIELYQTIETLLFLSVLFFALKISFGQKKTEHFPYLIKQHIARLSKWDISPFKYSLQPIDLLSCLQ
jgi:hypothetical protein